MKRSRHRPAVALAIALLAVSPTFAQSPSSDDGDAGERAALAREIRRTVEQLHQVRAERRRAATAHQEAITRIERQVDRLEDDLRQTRDAVDELQANVQVKTKSLNQAKQQQQHLHAWLNRARQTAQTVTASMRQRIATGIAHQQDQRTAKLDAVMQDLTSDAPARWAGAADALFSFIGEELQAGRSIALSNRPVTHASGRRVHAWVVRIGLVNELMISENGEVVGITAPDRNQRWRTDIGAATGRQISDALSILRKEASPHLVTLPFPVVTEDAGNASANGEPSR